MRGAQNRWKYWQCSQTSLIPSAATLRHGVGTISMKHPLTSPDILPTFDASFNDASSTGLLLIGGGVVLIAMG